MQRLVLLRGRPVLKMALQIQPSRYHADNVDTKETVQQTVSDGYYMTFTRYILAEQRKSSDSTGQFSQLLYAIQTTVKSISSTVRRLGLGVLTGQSRKESKIEEMKRLESYSHELFVQMLIGSYSCCMIASEARDEIILVDHERQGRYIVIFDPLDGKGKGEPFNIFGSTFSIFRRTDNKIHEKDVLQPGKNILAAGYALYGSATTLVVALGNQTGVNGFVLDSAVGEFLLCDPNLKIPESSNSYSINEGYSANWDEATKEYVQSKKSIQNQKVCSARYIGTMVADVHRILKNGGIFMYPATKENPFGKIKLMHKTCPISFIIEQAGGLASTGKGPVLSVVPEKIFQKTPVYIGSKQDVTKLLQIIAAHKSADGRRHRTH